MKAAVSLEDKAAMASSKELAVTDSSFDEFTLVKSQ